MAESQPAAPTMGNGMTAQMSIERIYVKDLSLENPGSPQSFQMTEAPQVEVGLRTRAEQVAPDVYECVLTLTVTARAGDKTAFLVEASQAGVFGIRGIPPDQLQPVLAIHCPTVPDRSPAWAASRGATVSSFRHRSSCTPPPGRPRACAPVPRRC